MFWAATDGEGLEWTPYSVSYHHNKGESDPGLKFTGGVNSSLYRGDMTPGQRHLDYETHAYTSLLQLTDTSGLILYQYTGKTVVNETRQCDEQPIQYLFQKRVWGDHLTAGEACAAANKSVNIGRTFYWNAARGTAADTCGHQACDCCWTGRSVAEPYKNGTFAMKFTMA